MAGLATARPSLSVCCLTSDPPDRLRAIFEPLRGVADEFVIGADSRTPAETLREYEELADRVAVFEFAGNIERHLAWLHEQASGKWILRLDTDEVASAALVEALPELTGAADVRQYWLPRRWLAADGSGWLDELPWAPDYQGRLVRNDGTLTFSGQPHSGVELAYPAVYLREPIYHLVCALETKDDRLVRTVHHELRRPLLIAPGGGPFNATYYLPERFAERAPAAVPTEDRPLVRAVLNVA